MKANSRQEMPVPGIIKSLSKLSSLQKNVCIFCLIVWCVCARVCACVCAYSFFLQDEDHDYERKKELANQGLTFCHSYVCGCLDQVGCYMFVFLCNGKVRVYFWNSTSSWTSIPPSFSTEILSMPWNHTILCAMLWGTVVNLCGIYIVDLGTKCNNSLVSASVPRWWLREPNGIGHFSILLWQTGDEGDPFRCDSVPDR